MKNKKIYKLAKIDEEFEYNEFMFIGFRKSSQIENKFESNKRQNTIFRKSLKERSKIEKTISKKRHARQIRENRQLKRITGFEEQCKTEYFSSPEFSL